MTKNNKGRDRWHGATPKTTDSQNHSRFIAIKPGRATRQQKRQEGGGDE